MINNNGGQHTVLDRITRITPTMRALAIVVCRRRAGVMRASGDSENRS